MRHRAAARLTTALTIVAASVPLSQPASAAAPGFGVTVGEQPGTFTIGKAVRTLTAVATTDRARGCQKVRWALSIQTDGIGLEQVRINRVEDNNPFRVNAQVSGDTAQLVDAAPDPGELCVGRTVTGRWDIAFAGPDDGTATFAASIFNARGRVLASTSTTIQVVTPVAARPTAEPTPTPTETTEPTEPTEEAIDQESPATADPTTAEETTPIALRPASGSSSVLGPGLIIGALLVFLGVALLLRLRNRNRRDPAWQTPTQALPTSSFRAPRRKLR